MDILRSFGKSEDTGAKTERLKADMKRVEKSLSPTGLKWLRPRKSAAPTLSTHLSNLSYFRDCFKKFQDTSEDGQNPFECMITRLEKVNSNVPKNLKRLDLRRPDTQQDSSIDYPYPADSKFKNKLPLPTRDTFSCSPKNSSASTPLSSASPPPSLEVFQRIFHQSKTPQALLRTVERPAINEVAIKLHWTLRDTTGSRPESREGAGMCVCNHRLYLFGGVSMTKRNDTRILDTKTWTWTQLQTLYTPKGRIGHTVVYYKKQLIVCGGWSNYSQRLGVRRCYKKLYTLFLEDELRWQRFRGVGKVPKSRRYHSAAAFGGSMLMYGGVDTQCKVLKGTNVLLLETLEWVKPKIAAGERPGARCNSSLTTVFHPSLLQRDDFTVFNPPRHRVDLQMPNSGFYLFGGLGQDGVVRNDLWVLTLGDGFLTWKQVVTTGVQPLPRSDHTALFTNGYLVVYGGRNDRLFPERGDSSIRDVSLLSVTTLRWEVFKQHGFIPSGRWGHCAAVQGSRMIIFGGISTKEFLPSDVFVLETDQFFVKELIQNDADRRKARRDGILV